MITMGFFARLESNNLYFDRATERGVDFPAPVDDGPAREAFVQRLLPKGVVLAVGSGDGSSLAPFVKRGFEVQGVEPSALRRQKAIERGIPTIAGAFENLGSLALEPVRGLWCGAALRHVPDTYFARVLANVATVLPWNAPVFMTVELGEGSEWLQLDPGDEDAESLNQRFTEEQVDLALKQKGFVLLEKWRRGPWLSLLALKN